jgi:hypothetical protein
MREIDDIGEYRRRAQDCAEIAGKIGDAGYRLLLLQMARAWMHLAETAEKNRATATVWVPGTGFREPDHRRV